MEEEEMESRALPAPSKKSPTLCIYGVGGWVGGGREGSLNEKLCCKYMGGSEEEEEEDVEGLETWVGGKRKRKRKRTYRWMTTA